MGGVLGPGEESADELPSVKSVTSSLDVDREESQRRRRFQIRWRFADSRSRRMCAYFWMLRARLIRMFPHMATTMPMKEDQRLSFSSESERGGGVDGARGTDRVEGSMGDLTVVVEVSVGSAAASCSDVVERASCSGEFLLGQGPG